MPAHDAYLRLTPYERLLPEPAFAESHFPAIRTEMDQHPEAAEDPGAFALLESSRRALAELRDPDGGAEDHGTTHALLLFHAFHLHDAGVPHLLVTVPVSRWAVEGEGGASSGDKAASGAGSGPGTDAGSGAGEGGLAGAAYVQLPQHLFWIRDDDEAQPASLDGFFWTVRGSTLHLLGIAGMQGRAGEGFRVLPLPGVPLADAPVWLAETMRESGDDFRSEMPGAELEGLYELRTTGELLKLAARIDAFVRRFPPGSAVETAPATPEGPPPGASPYTRVTLT
jgi:hypothetical protein